MKNRTAIQRYRKINFGYKSLQIGKVPTKLLLPSDADIAKRYLRAGEAIFDKCYFSEMGSDIPEIILQKSIVASVYFKSLTELNTMIKRRTYYSSNAKLFKIYMKTICNKISRGQNLQKDLISDFLFNSIYLLFEHQIVFDNKSIDYGVSKSHQTPFYKIYWSSRSIVWHGITRENNIAIASLRLSMENRIRSAFGIYGIFNRKTHETKPVSMSAILMNIKKHSKSIEINPSIDEIIRIYHWSNNYIHALYSTYPWLVIYAHDVLQPLFEFGTHKGHKNPNYNIKSPRHIIEEVRKVSNYNKNLSEDWFIDGPDVDDCKIAII